MKKFIHVVTGKEVKYGDILIQASPHIYYGHLVTQVVVDKDNIERLKAVGAIAEVDTDEPYRDIGYYLQHLSERINTPLEELEATLDNLKKFHPIGVLFLILKEIALVSDELIRPYMDVKYDPGYIIDYAGDIVEIKGEQNLKSLCEEFPLFSSRETAEYALKIVKEHAGGLFSTK
jgi:hypothetical protein